MGCCKTKVSKRAWRVSAPMLAIAFVLCILCVVVFRDWTARERLRKAEERLSSCADKWNRTVCLPVAMHGDALTAASLPRENLFADISVRDEHNVLRPVPKASMEGESLSVANGEICGEDIQDALKRLTGRSRFAIDGFAAFIGADRECSHHYVARLIDGFNSFGIWNVSIIGRIGGEAGASRLSSFKILRLCPCVLPKEDLHVVADEPFEEEDLSVHYVKPFSLGQRLTFWIGSRSDGSLDGTLLYCDKQVSFAELDGIMAQLAADPETTGKTVAIRCAEDSPHNALVNVLDMLFKHNFKRVYLMTL